MFSRQYNKIFVKHLTQVEINTVKYSINANILCKSVGWLYRDKKERQKKETSKKKLRLRFSEGSFKNRHNGASI